MASRTNSGWRKWYYLTKPGIIYGNSLHLIAGFLFSYVLGTSLFPGIFALIGTGFMIASACVANNYIDRDIDARMKRTKTRATVDGSVSAYATLLYALILFGSGVAVLVAARQGLVLLLGLVAYVSYVWIYTYAKRTTIHSTLIGTIPGAVPLVAGYVVNPGFSVIGALLLFVLLVSWQMPHFYAISLYRKKEYKAAKLPVAGVVLPEKTVANHMIMWGILYLLCAIGLIWVDVLGIVPGLLLLVAAMLWLRTMSRPGRGSEQWARQVFKQSMFLVLTLLVSALLQTLTS